MAVFFGALCLALAVSCVYQWWWHQRYRRAAPLDGQVVRLRGAVAGPEPREPALDQDTPSNAVELIDDRGCSRTIRVDGPVPLVGRRVLRVGDRVTVDGVWTAVARDEALYRERGCEWRVDALRLMAGTWPRALWLPLILLGLALVVGAQLCWAAISTPQGLFAETAARLYCPPGTTRHSLAADPEVFFHLCKDAAGRRHGPYAVWSRLGQLREEGRYQQGKLARRVEHLVEGWLQRHARYRDNRLVDERYQPVRPRPAADYPRPRRDFLAFAPD
jgi:hypothetical protein